MAVGTRQPLVVIGPTGSGKSRLALQIARKAGGEILSVDSMTIYRGMDVGTAKPTAQERAEVPHHLMDIVEPDEAFTVARFVEMADGVIADAAKRGVPLVVTGGTPLYYKALFEGLFDGPGADAEVRQRLMKMGNEAMHRRLMEVDPLAGARIHVNDTKRLVRALEVHALTGRPISAFQTEWAAEATRHPATWVGLMWDREVLNRRINARVKQMMAEGWVEELRGLLDRYGGLSRTAAEATGYRELIEHIEGRLSRDDAVERIKIATRQLARKQMKWFKRFRGVRWLDGEAAEEQNIARAIEGWT